MAAVDSFWNDYQGKAYVSFDGIPANAGQCVQSVAFYTRDYLHAPVMYADAVYWYINFENSVLSNNFTKIPNSPTNAPQHGDIVVWNGNLPNSGGAGHIAVAWSNSPGYFVSIDSNWAGKYIHMVSHNYDYVLGWLRPNGQANTPQGGAGVIIGSGENWYGRLSKLHEQVLDVPLSREVFNSYVGKDTLSFIEALSDNPAAAGIQEAQKLGILARQDNWQGQIYTLQDQLKTSQDIANKLNQAVVEAQNASKADLQAALAKVADLTAQLQTANDKLVDIQKQQTEDTKAGDSFLRRLGQLITKYLPGNK